MKEHHRTDRLIVITILLVVLVAVVVLSYKAPELKYEKESSQVLTELSDQEYGVSIQEFENLASNENTSVIDLRNSGDFFVSHIEGAINIPTIKILEEEAIDLFEEEDKTYILYGQNHFEANGPWLLLKQLGFENIRVLVGGYDNYLAKGKSFPDFYQDVADVEKAKYNLKAEIDSLSNKYIELDKSYASNNSNKAVKSAPKKKSPPKVVAPIMQEEEEEDEDEGC